MRANYETAFERETDCVCRIVNENPHKSEYQVFVAPVDSVLMADVPVQQMPVRRQNAKCVRVARRILGVMSTVCATLTVVAAVNGNWQSAFAGTAVLLVAMMSARITE